MEHRAAASNGVDGAVKDRGVTAVQSPPPSLSSLPSPSRSTSTSTSTSTSLSSLPESPPKTDLRTLAPNADEATPLYLQLVRNLTQAIHAGVWRSGEALPAERVLCESLDVSRVTLRMALDMLVEQGLVTRRQGAGTFVRSGIQHSLSSLTSFSEELRRKGYEPGTRWLDRTIRPVYGEEMFRLGLSPDDRVAGLTRLRSADGKVMAYEQSVVPERYLPDPTLVEDSLYACLDARATPVVRALQHFRAVNLSARLAKYLDMAEGEAILRVMRVGYGRDGGAIELTDTYCHSDYYDFVAELRR